MSVFTVCWMRLSVLVSAHVFYWTKAKVSSSWSTQINPVANSTVKLHLASNSTTERLPWLPEHSRGIQQAQGIQVVHAPPLSKQGVDVGETRPLPARSAGQNQRQPAGFRVAEITLLPQQTPVLWRQPGYRKSVDEL